MVSHHTTIMRSNRFQWYIPYYKMAIRISVELQLLRWKTQPSGICDRGTRECFKMLSDKHIRPLGPVTVHHEQSVKRERERKNQQDATIRCLLLTSVSTCFGHHYVHLQENKGPVTAFGVLLWFCMMWAVLTSYKAAPHNRYQPHPTKPEQYTKCSNTVFDLLKMA